MSESVRKLWVNGISGRMGGIVGQLAIESESHVLVGGTSSGGDFKHDSGKLYETTLQNEDFNVIIDFSTPTGNAELLEKLANHKWRDGVIVIATTAIETKQLDDWQKFSKTNKLQVLVAPNASLGANTFISQVERLAQCGASDMFDIEIIEKHHREKNDSPSGTAKHIAEVIRRARPDLDTVVIGRKGKRAANEISIHSLRGGTIMGEHSVSFMGEHERITITHSVESRAIFAYGALVLVEWLFGRKSGYGFHNVYDVFN